MSDNQSLARIEPMPAMMDEPRSPQALMRRATDVASVCREIVLKTAVQIQGRKFLRVEGWESIATAHGCFAGAEDVERAYDNQGNHIGYKAKGVLRNAHGEIIATGEGFVGFDEKDRKGNPTWKNRDEYAGKAMAQCVPLRAEILTRSGWKRWDGISVGDEVLAYDPGSDQTKWVKLEAINVFAPAELIRLHSRSFDVTCTPEHTWAVGKQLVKANAFTSQQSITVAAPNAEGEEIPESIAAVAGWLLTDGTIRQPARGNVRMHIDQSKEPYVEEIRELLDAAGLAYTEIVSEMEPRTFPGGNTSTLLKAHRFALRTSASSRLQAYGLASKSDGPEFATRIGPQSRHAMLDAMLKADGTCKDGRRWRFGKLNTPVMDTFQILATLNGRALGKLSGFTMVNGNWMPTQVLRVRRKVSVYALQIEKAPDESVWCPTTPLGTWVMRLDGTVTITGNTRAISRTCRGVFAHVVVLIDAGLSTTPAEEVPDGGFDDNERASSAKHVTPKSSERPGSGKPEPGNRGQKENVLHTIDKPKETPKATEKTRSWFLAEMRKLFPEKTILQWACDDGPPFRLMPNERLEDWPLHAVPTSTLALQEMVKRCAEFMGVSPQEQPKTPSAESKPVSAASTAQNAPQTAKQAPSAPRNAPSDSQDHHKAEWYNFPMPYGKNAGVILGKLPKNYLYGLWKNYTVETEYNGKPKKKETIEADRTFRVMLDHAGVHYKFDEPKGGTDEGSGEPDEGGEEMPF